MIRGQIYAGLQILKPLSNLLHEELILLQLIKKFLPGFEVLIAVVMKSQPTFNKLHGVISQKTAKGQCKDISEHQNNL
jgi:hypothetical protein